MMRDECRLRVTKLGLYGLVSRSFEKHHQIPILMLNIVEIGNYRSNVIFFIIHHSSFIIHHSSFIIHHSSFIIHHSSFIIHHSSFIIHHSSFIAHHSSLIAPHYPAVPKFNNLQVTDIAFMEGESDECFDFMPTFIAASTRVDVEKIEVFIGHHL
jgi:hypothetical protein